jgi:hypothetical protein
MKQSSISEIASEPALLKLKRANAKKLRAGFAREILKKHRWIVREANNAKTRLERAMQAAFECGRLLVQEQQQLGRKGNFDAWCAEFVPEISRATIYRYKSLFEQVIQYLEASSLEIVDPSHVRLCELNFSSLRQLYIAFGILPNHEANNEPKPGRSFLDPLLKVLGSSRFDSLKDDRTLDRLSREELFMLDKSLEPFLRIKSRIEQRLSTPGELLTIAK